MRASRDHRSPGVAADDRGSPLVSSCVAGLVQTLDKLAESCVMHLTPDKLHFVVVSETKENVNLHVSADVSQVCLSVLTATSAPPPVCP